MLGKKYEVRRNCAASIYQKSNEGPESRSHKDEALTGWTKVISPVVILKRGLAIGIIESSLGSSGAIRGPKKLLLPTRSSLEGKAEPSDYVHRREHLQ